MSCQRVLITGGAGFIGSYFVRKFLKMGAYVDVFDNLSTGTLRNLPKDANLLFHYGDILDEKKLKILPKVDLVVHLASIVGMKLAKNNAKLTYDTATKGTENVLRYTHDSPVLLLSSSSVYGLLETNKKVKENVDITLNDLKKYDGGVLGYACGKWHMEQIALNASTKGRKVLIIRPFNIVGDRQLPDHGMVLPSFISSVLNNLPLKVYGNGKQYRCFSDVNVFVDSVIKLMQSKYVWNVGNNIFNIGSDSKVTIQFLAEKVIEITRSSSRIIHVPFQDIFPNQVDVLARTPDISLVNQYIANILWPSIDDIIEKVFEYKLSIYGKNT